MPVAPTYPGVYIEEIPSAVRTIVGVPTAITAFIGYTLKGPSNRPTQIFNFGDYTRTFGDIDPDSPVSYAVQQFFLNGGVEAWIVRVTKGAAPATVIAENDVGAGAKASLDLAAQSGGLWGNNLQVEVDRAAGNPYDQFNLKVTEYRVQNGALVPANVETFRNLSMNKQSPNFVEAVVGAGSQLLTVTRDAAVVPLTNQAYSQSGNQIVTGPVAGQFQGTLIDDQHNALTLSVDGKPAIQVTVGKTAATGLAALNAIGPSIVADALTKGVTIGFNNATVAKPFLRFTSGNTESSSVQFSPGAQNDASKILLLGLANGGIEQDGSWQMRPAETGTVGQSLPSDISTLGLGATGDVNVVVNHPTAGAVNVNGLHIWTAKPATLADIASGLQAALRGAADTNPSVKAELNGATVSVETPLNALRIVMGGAPDTWVTFADAGDGQAPLIGLTGGGVSANVAKYTLGSTTSLRGKIGGTVGADGTKPAPGDLIGDQASKTGLYALEGVDLFNILCIPLDVPSSGQLTSLWNIAIDYCDTRRAFYILDMPNDVMSDKNKAKDWIDNKAPRDKNAASYFPWIMVPDPVQSYRARGFPPSGAIAGLYARTDAARGVWKAPAGTEAVLRGPVGTTYKMTDLENGSLNPDALNGIRTFPIYGNVVWGARTLFGADAMASEWKYIPVRRLALFIEESLFRGTKWVVFEPNDEPLWAQIRLNVGAFMHDLFRKGAFQGQSPREAYLVKCDKETTTQNDINSGIVNILVGFAPLKPAEFVIIKITQLAGQVEV